MYIQIHCLYILRYITYVLYLKGCTSCLHGSKVVFLFLTFKALQLGTRERKRGGGGAENSQKEVEELNS